MPFLLGWKYKQVPLELVGWLVLMGSSILALNLLRRHNRPAWLKHVLQATLAGRVRRRWLPHEDSPAWLLLKEET